MSHSYFSVYLHYVFATKKRQNDITPEIEKTYKKVFASICQDHGCFLMAANGTENHVHVLVSVGREALPSKLIRSLKSMSSKEINELELSPKRFSWQVGYGVFSVGRFEINKIKGYIAKQKEHHKTISFDKEYELMLEEAKRYAPH
jgi:putative transposase